MHRPNGREWPARRGAASLGIVFVVALACTPLGAQRLGFSVDGTTHRAEFGRSVADAGDVDGDGSTDIIVGSPGAGLAEVLSGTDGRTLQAFAGTSAGDLFGRSVAAAGDVDGDGYGDVIVGAPKDDSGSFDAGAARVFSGKTGAVLHEFVGAASGDWFGWSVAGAGDLDGDGWDDVVVGAPGRAVGTGSVAAYSGASGDRLFEIAGRSAGARLGWAVAVLGDVDGDGNDDLLAGAPDDSEGGTSAGRVAVFSGVDGAEAWGVIGNAGERFGWSVAAVGDVDGDGVPDATVGAPQAAAGSGRVAVLSGSDGSEMLAIAGRRPRERLGSAVSGGDVDGDGIPEVLAGLPGRAGEPGVVRVFEAATGAPVVELRGRQPGDGFGVAAAVLADADGDGFGDLAVGVPEVRSGAVRTGSLRVDHTAPFSSVVQTKVVREATQVRAEFGDRMRVVGDVSGDGVPDYLVGAPFDAGQFGTAWLYSGADHSLLRRHLGPSFDSLFGTRVGPVGDLDGDGRADYAVGGWHHATTVAKAGMAAIYSGIDGSLLFTYVGQEFDAHMGSCFGVLGDIDGDGTDDFFVGEYKVANGTGLVHVHSGATGGELYRVSGGEQGEWFGVSGAGLPDVDGDGVRDFAISAPSTRLTPVVGAGYAVVLSGVDGREIHRFLGLARGDRFGWSIAHAGDVNGDGIADVIVGGDGHDPEGRTNAGMARVYSGFDGSVLHHVQGQARGDLFGWDVGGAGDVNGDGYDDFLVGAPSANARELNDSGKAYLYSGFDGAQLRVFTGNGVGDVLGQSVMGALADSNGDGYPDLVVSAPRDDDVARDSGTLRVMQTVVKSNPASVVGLGAGCPDRAGRLPRLGVRGRPVAGGRFEITLRAAPANGIAVLAFDTRRQAVDLAPLGRAGCILQARAQALPVSATASGRARVSLTAPAGVMLGEVYAQWLVVAPEVATSRGIALTFGSPAPAERTEEMPRLNRSTAPARW